MRGKYIHSKLSKKLEEKLPIGKKIEEPVEVRDFRYPNHLKAANLKNSLIKTQYAERNSNNLGGLSSCCIIFVIFKKVFDVLDY